MPATMPLRLGPRPLPLHLATVLLSCTGSLNAWQLWKNGSPDSKPPAPASPGSGPPRPPVARARSRSDDQSLPKPEEISAPIEAGLAAARAALLPLMQEAAALIGGQPPAGGAAQPTSDPFAQALQRETMRRLDRLTAGISAYRHSPVRRDLPEAPTVWEEASTQLLDYAPMSGAANHDSLRPVLIVPSLINRWHVLDLNAERSVVRFLARQGLRPFVVDWGTPGPIERQYDCAAYVGRLERALAFVRASTKQKPAILGYCMGGTLTMALAQRNLAASRGLVLMAAPWDFHADRTGQSFIAAFGPAMAKLAEAAGELPVDVLQMLFWSIDPWQVARKFERFAAASPHSATTRDFVLLEDWLNGGAPLAGPVARECLLDWYGENLPGRGEWRIDGEAIKPDRVELPTLVLIPSGDRIVPPASAAAVCAPGALPRATRLDLPLGHIGMVTSGRAPDLCWQPLARWLNDLAD